MFEIKNIGRTIFFIIAILGILVGIRISEELGVVMVGGSLVLGAIDDNSWKMFIKY